MSEDMTARLRECAQLDWIDSTFAAATMREAADEIERLRAQVARLSGGGGSGGGGMAGVSGLTLGGGGGGAGGDYIKPQRTDTDELPYMFYAPTGAQGAGSGGGSGGAAGGAMEWPLKHTVVKPSK